MANDRLYLRCKNCGTCFYLGKHFMDPFFWVNYRKDGRHLEDFLNDFFDQHCWCSSDDDPDSEFNSFELLYESDPDFGKKYKADYVPSVTLPGPEPDMTIGSGPGGHFTLDIDALALREAFKSDNNMQELLSQIIALMWVKLDNIKQRMEEIANEDKEV